MDEHERMLKALEEIDQSLETMKTNREYWLKHWKRVKCHDVVASSEKAGGCMTYLISSPRNGVESEIHTTPSSIEAGIIICQPYYEVSIYWSCNRQAKRCLPSIRKVDEGCSIYARIDMPLLLGKNDIHLHVRKLADKDLFNVGTERAISAIDEAISYVLPKQ